MLKALSSHTFILKDHNTTYMQSKTSKRDLPVQSHKQRGKQEKWGERGGGSWGKGKQLLKTPNRWSFSCLLIISA